MKITDSYIIDNLSFGAEVCITMSGLGTRVATIQFEDEGGFHDIPEDKAVSSGDTHTVVVEVPKGLDPSTRSTRLKVSLTAGAGETVNLNWNLTKH